MTTGNVQTGAGKIAWRQSAGAGPAIVLVHGNSASSKAFARQLDGPLGRKYRIIAFDLPGHGESGDAAEPAKTYNMPGYARVLREVARQRDAEGAVFVGWSLGGHIVLEAAPDLPRAKGFAIFGTPPLAFPPAMEQAFLPNPAMAFTFTRDLSDEQARAYVAVAFRPGAADFPAFMADDVLRTDGRARENLAASIAPDGFRDEVKVVAGLTQPLAVLHGAEEQLINGGYFANLEMPTLWRGAVQTISGAGHIPQWEQAEAFDALLDAFVTDCVNRQP
jgi:pimeloyl-ACP methyl ester carboxylesterase